VKGTVVIALGGNALIRPGQTGRLEELTANALAMAESVRDLVESDWRVVLVHGNGPQVGNLSYQQEDSAASLPPLPLFLLDAMTQGEIGSLLSLALRSVLKGRRDVVTVLTHVVVDPGDDAFRHPTKPIGPFFEAARAEELASARGWTLVNDAGRGIRRVVASPQPQRIVEIAPIRALVDQGCLVISCGGGGIPVATTGDSLVGVDAVIDKDLAAERLATDLHADALAMVTEVSHVALDWGTPRARNIEEMSASEATAFARQGQFPPGSMGPKVTAGLRFLRRGGGLVVITSPDHLREAIEGRHGTRMVRDRSVAVA